MVDIEFEPFRGVGAVSAVLADPIAGAVLAFVEADRRSSA